MRKLHMHRSTSCMHVGWGTHRTAQCFACSAPCIVHIKYMDTNTAYRHAASFQLRIHLLLHACRVTSRPRPIWRQDKHACNS